MNRLILAKLISVAPSFGCAIVHKKHEHKSYKQYPNQSSVSMPMLLDAIQASLTARMGLLDYCSNEHSNLQQDVNIFNAMSHHMERNYEHNGLITRAEKLEQLKIAISKLQVTT